MPNVSKLCQEGVTFTNAFCPSPHCCPSRATFFTGLYPSEHGVWNNVDVGNALSHGLYENTRIWSDDLKETGYRLFFSGKWHVSAEETPIDRGWQMTFPPSIKTPYKNRSSRPPLTNEWDQYKRMSAQEEPIFRKEGEIIRPGYSTYIHYGETEHPFSDQDVVDDALGIIRTREKSEAPWCQFIGTLGPHDPYFVPQKYLDMYPLDSISLPDSFYDQMLDKPNLYRRTRERFDQLTEREHKEALRHYLAFCSYEDALFGQIYDALEECDELENTLILYLSDHGDYASDHGLWCKGLPCFKSAYHIPAVIHWPKGIQAPGRIVDNFVSLADFAPTLLEIAGVTPNRKFAGESLLPFLKNKKPASWRDAVFTQSNGNELYGIQRSIMTTQWKYVYNGFDYDELYDLVNDPHEINNLAQDPKYKSVIRQFSRRLWKFAYNQGDVCINSYIMTALAPFGPGEAFCDNC